MKNQTLFQVALSVVIIALLIGCAIRDKRLENVEVLLDLKKYDKALEVLDIMLETSPKSPEVHLLRGRALIGLNDLPKAEDAFNEAIALGGSEAAKQADQFVLNNYRALFDEYDAPKAERDRSMETALESLSLLSSDDLRRETFRYSLDELVNRDRQSFDDYRLLAEFYYEELMMNEDVLLQDMVEALEKLARRVSDHKEYAPVVYSLVRHMPPEVREPIENILSKYPNDEGNARRTMADMRSIGTATEAYAVDNARYPLANNFRQLVPFLQPTYIRAVPTHDGWNTEFRAQSNEDGYFIVSAGSDKQFEKAYSPGDIPKGYSNGNFELDIIYSLGAFDQFPISNN